MVCLEGCEEGHKVILGCHHSFHLHCWIDLEKHCNKSFVLCPLCRFECPRILPFKRDEGEGLSNPVIELIMARFILIEQCVNYVREATSARTRILRSEAALIVLATVLPRLGMSEAATAIFIRGVTLEVFAPLLAGDLMEERQTLSESYTHAPVPHMEFPAGESTTQGVGDRGEGKDDLDGFEREFAAAARRRQIRLQKRKRREEARKKVIRKTESLKESLRELGVLDPSLKPYIQEEVRRLDVMKERVGGHDSSSSSDD